jgi:hypothetical protein
MTPVSSLRRVRRRLYSARKFVVIRTPLGGAPVADHIGDVVFRRADSIDLDRLDTLEAYGRGSTQRAYVTKGHDALFVACHGDRIVATRRCSHEIRDPLAARVVELGAGQIWGADIFCLPECTGARVWGAVWYCSPTASWHRSGTRRCSLPLRQITYRPSGSAFAKGHSSPVTFHISASCVTNACASTRSCRDVCTHG